VPTSPLVGEVGSLAIRVRGTIREQAYFRRVNSRTMSSLRKQGPPRERNALIATPRLLD